MKYPLMTLLTAFLLGAITIYALISDSIEFPPRSKNVYKTVPFSETEKKLKECRGCHIP